MEKMQPGKLKYLIKTILEYLIYFLSLFYIINLYVHI